ncbi:hypothetical protein [Bradyrhizobium sp. SZCCHNS3052]|uniref:hypothetical protein n=1 Tax=Bradyrhizobium sp. SZCCHNS3052 TaxID=3057321 RepID=UPI002916D718|nr:hypothetical protein [Bradyrhizobium sp. SZCCHNS3052]
MSNPSLQDVRQRRQKIQELLTSLTEEDRELYAAEKTLMRLGGLGDKPPMPVTPPLGPHLPPPPVPKPNALTSGAVLGTAQVPQHAPLPPRSVLSSAMTNLGEEEEEEEDVVEIVKRLMAGNENLEQLTLMLLENCADVWWTATEIQDCLQRIKGREVPMGSISPMLTALKNNGTITRNGHNVALTTKAREEALR